MVVVLEDLHWADESSLQLLLHVAPSVSSQPLLVIGTYRDVELDVTRPFARALEGWCERHARRLTLRRLPLGCRRQLAAIMAAGAASLARVIFKRPIQPFFVEEVFQHLKEGGLIRRRG
jgi:predicted ATPase